MQDRFKFRIYNKCTKRMFQNVTSLDPLILATKFDEYAYNYAIMQCTGLKDKNDKLIYEGDIVKFRDYHQNWLIGQIFYDTKDCTFINEYELNGKKDWDYVSHYCLEVIGNRYENPELLKSEG